MQLNNKNIQKNRYLICISTWVQYFNTVTPYEHACYEINSCHLKKPRCQIWKPCSLSSVWTYRLDDGSSSSEYSMMKKLPFADYYIYDTCLVQLEQQKHPERKSVDGLKLYFHMQKWMKENVHTIVDGN